MGAGRLHLRRQRIRRGVPRQGQHLQCGNIKADGSAGAVETVVEMPRTVPDGLAYDTDGNLYISCYRPDTIFRYTPEGELQTLAEDYEGTAMAAPTNVAFCGEDLDMFISANIGRWHLTQYDLDATGLPLNYPTFS